MEQSDVKDCLFAPFTKLFFLWPCSLAVPVLDNYDGSVQIKNWKFHSRNSKLKGLMNEKFTK